MSRNTKTRLAALVAGVNQFDQAANVELVSVRNAHVRRGEGFGLPVVEQLGGWPNGEASPLPARGVAGRHSNLPHADKHKAHGPYGQGHERKAQGTADQVKDGCVSHAARSDTQAPAGIAPLVSRSIASASRSGGDLIRPDSKWLRLCRL